MGKRLLLAHSGYHTPGAICSVPEADVVKLMQYGFTKNIRYILS